MFAWKVLRAFVIVLLKEKVQIFHEILFQVFHISPNFVKELQISEDKDLLNGNVDDHFFPQLEVELESIKFRLTLQSNIFKKGFGFLLFEENMGYFFLYLKLRRNKLG